MLVNSQYKQDLWNEYNYLINNYNHQNDSYSVNCRLIHMNSDESNYDNVGGSLENWRSSLTQLKWDVYENVPLFMNAPATTSNDTMSVNSLQSFTASLKFVYEPMPNDMLMFYDDQSVTVYHITSVRFHKTIQHPLKIFEVDLQTTPIKSSEVFEHLNILTHNFFNEYNIKLFDYLDYYNNYVPILLDIKNIIREANGYFDKRLEHYGCKSLTDKIKYIKSNSHYGAISQLHTPLNETDEICDNSIQPLLDKLQRVEDLLCK